MYIHFHVFLNLICFVLLFTKPRTLLYNIRQSIAFLAQSSLVFLGI
jgi:hypothetical protein